MSPYQLVQPTVTGGCAYYASDLSAAWSGYTSQGQEDYVWFYNSSRETWDIYDSRTLGTVTWRPAGADESRTYNSFTQNSPTTDIRVGSWSSLYASRYGTQVNVWGNASRYSTYWQKPIAWQTTATIQYRNVGSTTWNTLKTVSINGSYKYTYYTSAQRDYRVVFAGTQYIWSNTSTTVRK